MTTLDVPSAGVGQTAMFVALLRSLESRRGDALFRDALADFMVTALRGDTAMADVAEVVARTHLSVPGFAEYFSVRTRFFDDELLAAMGEGVRQVVTLAAGVDGRTVRLASPPGTCWYELDLPEMTAFKESLLAGSALGTRCVRRPVAADLRGDWTQPLRQAGFDPAQPTAWLAEGLLMYLPDADGEMLLHSLTQLSAPGSRLMLEQLQELMLAEPGRPARERVESQGASWRSARDDIGSWLSRHGWDARVYASTDPRIAHGRTVAPMPAGWLASGRLIRPPATGPVGT
ncbi:MAG TPA: SAM-dependent methyltransferase [Rugosimonospora sp.]|nr:SAM-dependent methyltransferase [Rugosimonospora sp.]